MKLSLTNILKKRFILYGLPKSLYLNFAYFPLSTALKLPILCSHYVTLSNVKGAIDLEVDNVKMGMIRLGFHAIGVYNRDDKSIWSVSGRIIIRGKLSLGSGFALSVEKDGVIEFGHDVICSAMIKIICQYSIVIGASSRIAWEVIISDTNFHWLINRTTGLRNKMNSQIIIGANNWIGVRTLIWKGTRTPNFCTVSAGTILTSNYDFPEYSVIGENPAVLKSVGWYRDLSDE